MLIFPPAAAITISGPSQSAYWVQYTTNVITWSYTAGDPNPIDILVINQNDTTLNGDFSIAQYVDVSQESFTVTNVTLVVGDNYAVEFVNPNNGSQVYAKSNAFSVKPPGTLAAPTSSVSPSSTGSASGSAASSTSPSSASGSSSSTSPSHSANAAYTVSAFGSTQGILGVIAACGVASLSALFL
ncbi:hypothetical protein AcW1_002326 [Taiwanofungus camphoratus]|nr:hypothetical protein AcV5_010327 [Antrodia cinnamomea]KAI0944667.1 hypothetical protein AcW1_002326 [Antrodia cinnamomea]KAI0946322.1 hypothetical protein AcV7_010328 [Antrodia cinnamomea]